MTIPELRAIRDELLADAKKKLSKDGSLDAWFMLLRRDGSREVVATVGPDMNNRAFKSALASFIRGRVAGGEVEAVTFVSDVFYANDMTPECELIQKTLGLDIEQSAAAGLCTKHEGIMVQIESPLFVEITRQEYGREGKRITFLGDPETMSTATGNARMLRSKMAGWFATPPRSEATQ